MKILLLGKDGQVGQALQKALPAQHQITAWGRSDVDLENTEALARAIADIQVDVIVNAAAYTAVDRAESEPDRAMRINATAVRVLAQHANKTGALLVHYSTDYVFQGDKNTPYLESDPPGPQSAYGKSKLEGEIAITQSGCQALVFRTSWVFSATGGNFIKTILRLAAERDTLNVVADQHGAPTSADFIADITYRAIHAYTQGRIPPGIYHLTPAGHTTWYDLACFVVARAQANRAPIKLQAASIQPITTDQYPLPARRPKNSCLNNNALATSLGLQFSDWKPEVQRIIDALTRPSEAP